MDVWTDQFCGRKAWCSSGRWLLEQARKPRKNQCTSREKGQDSVGACATHMWSTRHSNAILLSANTEMTFGWNITCEWVAKFWNFVNFWVLARILKNCTYKPRVYTYIFPPKNRPCRGHLDYTFPYVKDILKTRVVWGWRDDVHGEHWRTSVCVNNSQLFCHQLLKKGKDGAKLA